MAIMIDGIHEMPKACKYCRFARLVPFAASEPPKHVYKCFITRQVDTKEQGETGRLSECPLCEIPEPRIRKTSRKGYAFSDSEKQIQEDLDRLESWNGSWD